MTPARQQPQDALLAHSLEAVFGTIDPATLAWLQRNLQWVEVAGGATLMTQGEPGDSMYLSISGRLRAYVRDAEGVQRMVREMSRNQVIGEMSLFTDAPRSATVVAIRNSVLVRLDKAAFQQLIETNPHVVMALSRHAIKRLEAGEQDRSTLERPVMMAMVPITTGVDLAHFCARLSALLGRIGRTQVVDASYVDAALGEPGIARAATDDAEANRRIALLLDELESQHAFVLLASDASATAWTQRVSRHCDELLLLADATQPPALHAIEQQYLMQRPAHTEAAEVLVLLHPADARTPRHTNAWLARRPVADHVHVRTDLDRDMARLARLQSRTAVGLVLAGGGARGLAHLGIFRSLKERGIEVDCVGGTSIGAIIATYVATDCPVDVVMANAQRAFKGNPTGDYNAIPILSLIKGQRLRRIIRDSLHALLGFDAAVEDLWKNYFCIASNYSTAREEVIRHGSLARSVLASVSIPGALPPVIANGELLCDGGTFNNFPVDVMRAQRGVGTVIGVDLDYRKPRRIEFDDVPGSWAMLRDRLRPRSKRRFRLPSLAAYLMNVTILYSTSRQRAAQKLTDLYFNPPLARVGMLEWNRFDQIVEEGRLHGEQVLDAMAPDQLQGLRLLNEEVVRAC
jgi:NTE family protein